MYFFQNTKQPQSLLLGHSMYVIMHLPRVQERSGITPSLDAKTLPLA